VAAAPERIFDEYLVASARLGGRAALLRLVERWQPKLIRHAARLTGDDDVACDIAQEAWIEILRGLPRLQDVAAFPAWAFRITTRRCTRWIRRRQRGRLLFEGLATEAAVPTAPDCADRAVDAATVRGLMAALPPAQKAAMALFYLEDLTVAEIAHALETPAGTIKTRLMHARDALRGALNPSANGSKETDNE
jgi:RNA polymerase sigma factor (sigma-70 family)